MRAGNDIIDVLRFAPAASVAARILHVCTIGVRLSIVNVVIIHKFAESLREMVLTSGCIYCVQRLSTPPLKWTRLRNSAYTWLVTYEVLTASVLIGNS